jgi:outer membrane murein-binding lipoprotein Lpp
VLQRIDRVSTGIEDLSQVIEQLLARREQLQQPSRCAVPGAARRRDTLTETA